MIPIHIDMNLKKNMEEHLTMYYDIPGLLLRRSQPFTFIVTFNQDFNVNKYHLSIIFKSQTWKNLPDVKIPVNGSSNGWSAKGRFVDNHKKDSIWFQIESPSHAIIGKYSVCIE